LAASWAQYETQEALVSFRMTCNLYYFSEFEVLNSVHSFENRK
jgi:hypothetical protein